MAKRKQKKPELTLRDVVQFFASYGWSVDFSFVPIRKTKPRRSKRTA